VHIAAGLGYFHKFIFALFTMRDDQSFSSWTVPTASETEVQDENATAKVLDFSVTPHRDCIGCSTPLKSTKVCFHIEATAIPDDDEDARPGVDVVACLDQSGSMAGNKFRDCKRTLQLMVKHLASKDRFGLVVYGSVARVVVPVQPMTPAAKAKASKKISALGTQGMTNLSGGLSLAIQEMAMIINPNPVRSIFLLTDGHANLGIHDRDGLIALVKTIQLNNGIVQPTKDPATTNKTESWMQRAVTRTTNFLSNRSTENIFAANVLPQEQSQDIFAANVLPQEQSQNFFAANVLPQEQSQDFFAANVLPQEQSQDFFAANVLPQEQSQDIFAANAPLQEQSTEAMLVDDGNAYNFGDSKPKEILLSMKRVNEGPISLICFGYGQDHDSATLRAMAEAAPGGGSYHFVEKDEDVASAFGDAMGGLMSVVAQSAVISLSVPDATSDAKILKVFHDEAVEREEGSFTVNVGDFYAEESRDVVLEVKLSSIASATPIPHVSATLTYTDVLHKCRVKEGPITCSVMRPPNDNQSPVNIDVEAQWLRVYTAEKIRSADRDAEAGNLTSARVILQEAKRFLEQSPAYKQNSEEARGLWQDLQDTLNGFSSEASYSTVGTHYAKTCGMKISKQRQMWSSPVFSNALAPNAVSPGPTFDVDAQSRYTTKSKRKMTKAFAKK